VLRKLATFLVLAGLAGCAAPAVSPPASPTAISTPIATATEAPPTLPPGVAPVHDGVLEPGTYWFEGFQPWLQLTIDRTGWEVGHFHDQEFDLFLDGTFPSIGFARFPAVATPRSSEAPAGAAVPASSIDAILDAWRSNPHIVVTEVGDVTVAGLSGRAVDVKVNAEQTPLFGAAGEAFKFDPGLASRFNLLVVEGGVVEIFVVSQTGRLEAALDGARSILDSLQTVD
jgi:hypothetical protein